MNAHIAEGLGAQVRASIKPGAPMGGVPAGRRWRWSGRAGRKLGYTGEMNGALRDRAAGTETEIDGVPAMYVKSGRADVFDRAWTHGFIYSIERIIGGLML